MSMPRSELILPMPRPELILPMRSVWLESVQSCNKRSKWPWKRYISKTRHLGSLSEDPTTEEKPTLSKCRPGAQFVGSRMRTFIQCTCMQVTSQGIPHSALRWLANQDVLGRRQIPHFNGGFGSGRVWKRNSEHRKELWSRLYFDRSV